MKLTPRSNPPSTKISIRVVLIVLVSLTAFVLIYVHSKVSRSPIPISIGKILKESVVLRGSSTSESLESESNLIQVPKKKIIAYAITVTLDGPFVDGALVLGYSALKVHDKNSGYSDLYDAELVAFVVPSVISSRKILEAYGWKIIEKTLPVSLEEIENQDYAIKMKDSGCCGADEFLKLWAYTLTEYHRVVHLDMDSLVLNNMVSTISSLKNNFSVKLNLNVSD